METHLQFQMLRLSMRDGEEGKNHTIERLNPLASPSSSPSASPSHEFSFTVPIEKPSTTTLEICQAKNSSISALDLSPADEIFFHGQLLPLHSLPRSSTDSSDHCFTLPIDGTTTTSSTSDEYHHLQDKGPPLSEQRQGREVRAKSKSFSTLFSLPIRLKRRKSRRENESGDRGRKRKLKLDVIKRCVGLVKPFLVSLRRNIRVEHRRRHSGNLRTKRDKGFGGWRREYSAPSSMIHSPKTYSGVLAASGCATPTYYNNLSMSNSTVEDLQEAIQAAIAHCKKSNMDASDGRTLQLQPSVLSI